MSKANGTAERERFDLAEALARIERQFGAGVGDGDRRAGRRSRSR